MCEYTVMPMCLARKAKVSQFSYHSLVVDQNATLSLALRSLAPVHFWHLGELQKGSD